MRGRCENPNNPSYSYYGGRGIRVCERWQSFDNFLADMGERPEGKSLDRIDNDGGYEPGNCRWATGREQQGNTSRSIRVSYRGKEYCLTELARELGLERMTLDSRIKKGWPQDRWAQQADKRIQVRNG